MTLEFFSKRLEHGCGLHFLLQHTNYC
jgi:hypothetical protein